MRGPALRVFRARALTAPLLMAACLAVPAVATAATATAATAATPTAATAATPTAATTPAASAATPAPGRIAFFDYVTNQIYAANPDGTALTQLTH